MFKKIILVSLTVFILLTIIIVIYIYGCPILKNFWITPSPAYKGDTLVGNIDWETVEGTVQMVSVKWISPSGVEYPLVIEVLANEIGTWTFEVGLYGWPPGADPKKDCPGWSYWKTSIYVNPIISEVKAVPSKIDPIRGETVTISYTLNTAVDYCEIWVNDTILDVSMSLDSGTHTFTWDGKIDGEIQYGENFITVYIIRDLITGIDDSNGTTVTVWRRLIDLNVEPSILPADGKSESTLTAVVIKEDGTPDVGKTVIFEIMQGGGSITVKSGKDVTNNRGEAVAKYIAGNEGERVAIRASIKGNEEQFDEKEIILLKVQILVNNTEEQDDDNVGVNQGIPIMIKTTPSDFNGNKSVSVNIANGQGSVNIDGKKGSSKTNDVKINVKINDMKLADEDLSVIEDIVVDKEQNILYADGIHASNIAGTLTKPKDEGIVVEFGLTNETNPGQPIGSVNPIGGITDKDGKIGTVYTVGSGNTATASIRGQVKGTEVSSSTNIYNYYGYDDWIAYNIHNLAASISTYNEGSVRDTKKATERDIQTFLEGYNSCLATFIYNGKSAAKIIADAAIKNMINPKVILVILQKESSLVQRTKPIDPEKESEMLNWVMGCKKPTNFESQIYCGASSFSEYLNLAVKYSYPVLTSKLIYLDKDPVIYDKEGEYVVFKVENKLTPPPYFYTPHIEAVAKFVEIWDRYSGF